MSNLVDHARTELVLIGEDTKTIEWYLSVVQAFVNFGHSGGSASVCIPVLNDLLQYKNLSPLTDDPKEWIYHNPDVWPPHGVWQSKRNPEAFSFNGGATYRFLSDLSDEIKEPYHSLKIAVLPEDQHGK